MTNKYIVLLITLGILLCLSGVAVLGTKVPPKSGTHEIIDNYVDGVIRSDRYSIILLAELQNNEHTELSAVYCHRLNIPATRLSLLEFVFGNLDGVTALSKNGEEYDLATVSDVLSYAEKAQGIESYAKDGTMVSFNLQDNTISFHSSALELMDQKEQINLLRQFANAIDAESCFNFEAPIILDENIILPVQVNELPLIAASQKFSTGNEDIWVLQYQGYNSAHMGLSLQLLPGEIVVQSLNTFIPSESRETLPIIPVDQAIDALRDRARDIYIGGKYPKRHPYMITEIRLAYGAVLTGEGQYLLEPVWAFIDAQEGSWDYCFFVNAHSGEVYPAISANYIEEMIP